MLGLAKEKHYFFSSLPSIGPASQRYQSSPSSGSVCQASSFPSVSRRLQFRATRLKSLNVQHRKHLFGLWLSRVDRTLERTAKRPTAEAYGMPFIRSFSISLLGHCEALSLSPFCTGAILGLLCCIPYLSNTFGLGFRPSEIVRGYLWKCLCESQCQ